MPKTVTLRLSDETYSKFALGANAENRSLSNFIETMALRKLEEEIMLDRIEMDDILSNKRLLKKLKAGSGNARKMKGRFVG